MISANALLPSRSVEGEFPRSFAEYVSESSDSIGSEDVDTLLVSNEERYCYDTIEDDRQ